MESTGGARTLGRGCRHLVIKHVLPLAGHRGHPTSLALGSCLTPPGLRWDAHTRAQAHTRNTLSSTNMQKAHGHADTRRAHTLARILTHLTLTGVRDSASPATGDAAAVALCWDCNLEEEDGRVLESRGPRRSPGWPPSDLPPGRTSSDPRAARARASLSQWTLALSDRVMLTGIQTRPPIISPYKSACHRRPSALPEGSGNESFLPSGSGSERGRSGLLRPQLRSGMCVRGGEPGLCHVLQSCFWHQLLS